MKGQRLLTQESINAVASKVCCVNDCVQPFSRERIRAFRDHMYQNTSFEFRNHMKLDVHCQVHFNLEGKRVVTIEGIDVCMVAWRHISGVPKSTFHCFQKYATRGDIAQPHGNLGLQKPRKHTEQATATLRCMLEKSADHMSHRLRILPSGEKVVSMILPTTFKWK